MTIAQTTYGPVQGQEKEGVLLFAGIPYAAPPTGSRRFRAPEPHDGWTDTRPALKFGPAAPQYPTGGLTASVPVRWDEDCLTLNIATPAIDDARRPVLFWIHGGAYRTGQGNVPWYNGARFARRGDLVVVSINYRLGALGFTDLSRFGDAFATSGVNGTLDQIAALRWVRENIAGFGGDPDRITVAGESAGAFSVCTVLASPAARGLFRAAIPQSGGAQHTLPPEAARIVADRFLEAAGSEDPTALQKLDASTILDAQKQVTEMLDRGIDASETLGVPVSAFYPVHGNAVLPDSPLSLIRQGAASGIPVLTGTNAHETTLWEYYNTTEAGLQRIASHYGASTVVDAYRKQHPHASPGDLAVALTTDFTFRIPAVRLLEAKAEADPATPNWMYWFCWESRQFDGRLKATHALEIPFVFDNLDRPGVDIFLGPGEVPEKVATTMHEAWIRFIRDIDPGWQPYDLEHRATMRFDTESTVVMDPEAPERRAWAGIR